MSVRPSAKVRSPRPDEPDVHVRFTYGGTYFDFAACRTAAANFMTKWQSSHNPTVTATVVRDGLTRFLRLPCEDLWLSP